MMQKASSKSKSVVANNKFRNILKKMENKKNVKNKNNRYSYTAINKQGLKVNGAIDGDNLDEIKVFLANEGLKVERIVKQNPIINMEIGPKGLDIATLAFILTQLSTYLKAGIPLIDAVRILEKQSVKKNQKTIFMNLVFELTKGESFSKALEAQDGVFPELLINMVKTSELTGDLPEILDDMAEYYTSINKTKKEVISAMTYPIIIFIFSIMVFTFILIYIIPEFVGLFHQNNASLPGLTVFVLNASNFLTNNFLSIMIVLIIIMLLYRILYKQNKGFRKAVQTLYMKLPIIGKIIIYKEVYMFTKTFASLLNHEVFITDSMSILSTISNNEVFKEIINDSMESLAKGSKISEAFRGKWFFPVAAYEMLVTGENTGKLGTMMDYVAKYYGEMHSNYVKRLNTFIEPIMIVLLALIVGTVVLSVVIPMFTFYSQVGY